ncbi:guanine nucleotide exchange factor subunit Rich [Olea europaea subsp. europaea]|uniref:Guanine nucleotide exchange factor subunit Rich n=1 Tax=Olea europaea subsp. europaea TaxID=158383 RepID=A0A8S0TKH1_OLEEU|nr:guanine nucleotide exchange factor subunit Rich [Olea europaea subsp. europaea]
MYYPVGWHKVLNLDTTACDQDGEPTSKILLVQANHERELYFILTTRSIHIWYPRPAAEIVCHRRSSESIKKLGLNRSAVWKTDSCVIVVATECDQLLFFQVRRRATSSSATSFLLPNSPEGDGIYRLKYDPKNIKKLLNGDAPPNPNDQTPVPALTIFSFGKLDLSSVGVSCLMSAEEELIVGAKNGQIYGVQWDGNVDDKFPWSLSTEVRKRSDYLVDIKFSSVLSGFSFVFKSGRVGFMPLRSDQDETSDESRDCDTKISYLPGVMNASCVEINHRHRLVAIGLSDSKVIVCNIGESNVGLMVNHSLIPNVQGNNNNNDKLDLGRVVSLRYSPDNFALAVSWDDGEFAIWSVFGSLLFCSQQWRPECGLSATLSPIQVTSLAWGREGYNLWLCAAKQDDTPREQGFTASPSEVITNGCSTHEEQRDASTSSSLDIRRQEEVMIMSLARCNLSTSPHQTCTADALVLLSEEKIYVGPSIPHEDKFDHWIVLNVPQSYLNTHYPVRYATVDRGCMNLAIAGNKGLAFCSIASRKWILFTKKVHEESFTVCGDMIWWRDYLIVSCFSFVNETFEIRAYQTINESLDSSQVVVQSTPMEIIRMSIFENRLLVLYSDGTLGMFMLNLRRRPVLRKQQRQTLTRSDSISSASGQLNGLDSNNHQQVPGTPRSNRSDSIISWSNSIRNPALFDRDLVLQISPIENLIISNLQANPFCISSVALTRLHFKNSRNDDSILLNACGKLFLLEREEPPDLASSSSRASSSNLSSPDIKDLSLTDSGGGPRLGASVGAEVKGVNSVRISPNSVSHFASASLRTALNEPRALSNVTFKAVSVIATNVELFWISPEISTASEMSYFKKSLWLSCGAGASSKLQVWLPLLNDKDDPPTDLYVPDRIMLPIKCDIYPLAIRSSAADLIEPDDAIVLGAECDVLYRDCKLFTYFPYTTVKRQCRVYLHRILRELLLSQHLGYYARKIAESCQTLPYFAHCFELLLHEVLEEEATSPVPLPDPMLPQVVKFIKEFPVYLETVVHCARKSELSMWSHLFDERAVGNPRRLFQECIERHHYDTAASCLIILQSLDKSTVSTRMVRELIRLVKENPRFIHLVDDLESFLARAELDGARSQGGSPSDGSS